MTRQSTKQRGITLVEVMLTLAISTLLITTVLAGRNSVRSQAQFSDGAERIKETILSVKSQANTGNSTNPNAKGTATIAGTVSGNRYLNLGRSIRFTKDSAATQTITILCYATIDLQCSDDLNEDGKTSIVTDLPWGIQYKNFTLGGVVRNDPQLSIIFTRNDQDGSFKGYWLAGRISDSKDGGGAPRSEAFINSMPITLNFESTDGRRAKVTVNPGTGTVVREVL